MEKENENSTIRKSKKALSLKRHGLFEKNQGYPNKNLAIPSYVII
jgi:hypothetical protein